MFYSPDWQKSYSSIEEAEKDLPNFKYIKDGWYITKTDTILAVQYQTFGEENNLYISVWNSPNAREQILNTINMTVHSN
jgi:hypothetical protein